MKSIYCVLLLMVLTLSNASYAVETNGSIPVHKTFTMESKSVNEKRTINVWTPDDYAQGTQSLPVMYMADGGIEEDFSHVANTFSKLIKTGKIPPFILVGIENTQRRRDLTGTTEVEEDKAIAPVVGESENFRAFISEELIPEINKRYRTTNQRGILGESLSGLFVVETFFVKPELFDYYIAFDPSLWWNDHYLLRSAKEHLMEFPKTKKTLWFAGSNEQEISRYTKELSAILTIENLPLLEWNFSDEPKENHGTIFAATKEKALIWALNKKNKESL